MPLEHYLQTNDLVKLLDRMPPEELARLYQRLFSQGYLLQSIDGDSPLAYQYTQHILKYFWTENYEADHPRKRVMPYDGTDIKMNHSCESGIFIYRNRVFQFTHNPTMSSQFLLVPKALMDLKIFPDDWVRVNTAPVVRSSKGFRIEISQLSGPTDRLTVRPDHRSYYLSQVFCWEDRVFEVGGSLTQTVTKFNCDEASIHWVM